jgi:AraC-like DNA-binding protein
MHALSIAAESAVPGDSIDIPRFAKSGEGRGTIAGRFVIAALETVRARGFDADALMRQAGVSAKDLESKHARVDTGQYGELWRLVALTLDDEFFGQDSRRMKAGSFAMLCRAVLQCESLQQALNRMLRFFGLLLDDMSGKLEVHGRNASVVIHDHNSPAHVFGHEVLLMLIHGLSCWLVGKRIEITHARFGYPEPPYSVEYRSMYCANLSFGVDDTAIVFSADHLKRRVIQSERTLKDFLRTAPETILVKYRNARSTTARVRRRLRQSAAATQFVPFRVLAAEFHMGYATLRRRLCDEGTSYQSIKKGVRLELAIDYLKHSDRDILSIGIELGYSERSAFHRAFRGWTGITPVEYRRQLAANNPVTDARQTL